MFVTRSHFARALKVLFGLGHSARPARGEATLRIAEVTAAIHAREVAGRSTTLRQLHKISDLGQPEALTIIAGLERSGIVVIDQNIGDAFESTIRLSPEARRRLDRVCDRKAA